MIRISLEDQDRDALYVQGLPRMAGRIFPLTPEGMREAMIACGKQPYDIDGALLELCTPTRPKTITLPVTLPDLPVGKTTLWEHQIAGAYLIMTREGVLVAADMGTGKTLMLIAAAQNSGAKRILVIAPKAVVPNWPRELRAHAVDAYQHFLAVDVTKPAKYRADQIVRFLSNTPADKPCIVIVDHATAWKPEIHGALQLTQWDIIAVDEAHRICDPSNKLSQFVYHMASANPQARRVALTGTPLGQYPLKVFGIARFVAPEVAGTNQWKFEHQYGKFRKFSVRTKQGIDREIEKFDRLIDPDAFAAMLAQFTFRVSKSVLKGLPEQTHTRRYAVMDTKTAAAYKALRKEWSAERNGRVFAANGPAEAVLRLQQFTGTLKRDLLLETLEALGGEPCVIFARFVEDLAIIRDTCKEAGLIYMEQSGRAMEWEKWQDGAGDVLGVQIQSGGSGVNLTRASQTIYFSHSYSLNDFDQSLSRMHRPGQTRHVNYTHLCVAGTIDEGIVDDLIDRREDAQALLDKTKESQEKESETVKNAA